LQREQQLGCNRIAGTRSCIRPRDSGEDEEEPASAAVFIGESGFHAM
jgi:hypothetical protein